MDTKENELIENEEIAEEIKPMIDSKKRKEKKKQQRVIKNRNSADKGIAGLLVAIIAVGACLLVVSVVGIVGVVTEKAPAETTTLIVPDNNSPAVNTPETTVADIQNTPVVETTLPQTVETTVAQAENNAAEETTVAQTENNAANNNESQNTAPVAGPQTDAEWLDFFNTSVNKLKTEAPAMTKAKQTKTADIQLSNPLGQTVVSAAKDKYLSDEVVETPIAKGDKASAQANISPDGAAYVSNLSMADIKSISHTVDGSGNYVIKIAMNDAVNPELNGPYGKVFEFMTLDDVMNKYAPDMGATVDRSNVELQFKNCSASATITPDGKVLNYETTVNANMILKEAKIKVITTDLDATLFSETKYKNITW